MITRRDALALGGGAVAAACGLATHLASAQCQSQVLPGLDVVLTQRREVLAGHSIGLITNPTGQTAAGLSAIDALFGQADWRLQALFSPEHGIRGQTQAGESVESSIDSATGLPIYSLYGDITRPTDAMLRGLDLLVFDIQDVGARTYTYASTLLEVMRAAAVHRLPVVVLDRPNPIGGDQVDGNVLDQAFASFVGPAPEAMRHGMTIGELGQFFNTELGVGATLNVVPMQGWQRSVWFDQTGLGWVNPSPNLRTLAAEALYPGMVLFEGTNVSEGRGTPTPFEWIGAPWVDGAAWAAQLNASGLTGVQFSQQGNTPDSSKFAGQACDGVAIVITDRLALKPMQVAVTLLTLLEGPLRFDAATFDGLAGTDQLRKQITSGVAATDIAAAWQQQLRKFESNRQQYLLY